MNQDPKAFSSAASKAQGVADYLLEFNNTVETPLERIESVDMLRVIESGGQVRMVMTESESIGVDTIEHLERVERLMKNDSLMKTYL